MAWNLNPLASLHWRCWDDEWVVFDVGSGQTHQMDTLTATTLMMLEVGSLDFSTLALQVANELLLPPGTELTAALMDTLDRLVTAGLVESTAP